jgi:amino acid transporter
VALVIAATLLSTLSLTLWILAAVAAAQVALTLALAVAGITRFGVSPGAFIGHGDFAAVASATASVSFLYICASLPLFLGGEVRGGTRTVRQGLGLGFVIVALLAILGAIPLAAAPASVVDSPIPGMALARSAVGQPLAIAVGLAVAASTAGLILAELIALSRLVSVLSHRSTVLSVRALAAALVVASLATLIDPERIYPLLLRPSLIALWISQLVVIAAYPWFAARRGHLAPADVGLTAGASALALYGLYTSAFNPVGT